MPTYEYRCPKGHEFELFQRMSDEPGAECPECGAEAERMLSAGAGFLFKGEGFYITDYRSDTYREAAKKESSEGSTEAPSASNKKKPDGKSQGSGTSKSDGGSTTSSSAPD
ncbi:MAG: zinc ribbon domain-containing protein [Gemmatimonadota bacterium]